MAIDITQLLTLQQLDIAELEQLHTGSLLGRLKKLRKLQGSFSASDWTTEEQDAVHAASLIAFKETSRWQSAYSELKIALSKREHVSRGSRERRQGEAHRKQ